MSTLPSPFVDRINRSKSTPINNSSDTADTITSISTLNDTSNNKVIDNDCEFSDLNEADYSMWSNATVSPHACCCCYDCQTSSSMRFNINDMATLKCRGRRHNIHLYPQVHCSALSTEPYYSRSKRASTITTATGDTGFFSMDDILSSRTSSPCLRSISGVKSAVHQLPASTDDSVPLSYDFESAQDSQSGITRSAQQHQSSEGSLLEQKSHNDQPNGTIGDIAFKRDEDYLWQENFLDLLSMIVQCSESLEWMTAEALQTERRVRELKALESIISKEYDDQEKFYLERLSEYEQVSNLQTRIMDDLFQLEHDLHLQNELNASQRQNNSKSSLLALPELSTNIALQTDPVPQDQHRHCNAPIDLARGGDSTLPLFNDYMNNLQPSSTDDIVHQARWQLGKWIGGSISTGRILHCYEGLNRRLEYVIAGCGTLDATTISILRQTETQASLSTTTKATTATGTMTHRPIEIDISSPASIHKLQRYQYFLHLNYRDQTTLFQLLSTELWIPDTDSTRCQFKACTVLFKFYQRRHHCRRCGILVCQKHSLNRLPLFNNQNRYDHQGSSSSFCGWYRVCDTCFYDLIIARSRTKTTRRTVTGHLLSAVDSAADLTDISDKEDLPDIP